MLRSQITKRIDSHPEPWDLVIIGGGATGVGVAIDAASRGYDTLLVEQSDFGKGTSSRSTKLIHGGVRYLERGNISLVREALRERGLIRQNAPHLVRKLGLIVPIYERWKAPIYSIGLELYDLLSGKNSFGRSRILSKEETIQRLPTIKRERLHGGVIYYDGQFDDARLLINMAVTALEQGAALLNFAQVTAFLKDSAGCVCGVNIRDLESGAEYCVRARVVVNAAGAFIDEVRRLADPSVQPIIAPSQGVHLVFDKGFLPGQNALLVPRTMDGRVLFAIPWNDHVIVGTTDTPISGPTLEPAPFEREIDFILETASLYLDKPPTRKDVLSVFTGIRPLVRAGDSKRTAALSRDHTIVIDNSGVLSIGGGKWTTYRQMAEDCVDHATRLGKLAERQCVTRHLRLHGFHQQASKFGPLAAYGSDAPAIQALIEENPALATRFSPMLPYTAVEVIWATRYEMARTVEDVLSRRTRALFLNSKAAVDAAPLVASLMAGELNRDSNWEAEQVSAFRQIAERYSVNLPRA